MTITLEITPEAQAELTRRAALLGCTPEEHAAILLEEAIYREKLASELSQAREDATRISLDEVFAKARGLADDLDFYRDSSPGRPIDLS